MTIVIGMQLQLHVKIGRLYVPQGFALPALICLVVLLQARPAHGTDTVLIPQKFVVGILARLVRLILRASPQLSVNGMATHATWQIL